MDTKPKFTEGDWKILRATNGTMFIRNDKDIEVCEYISNKDDANLILASKNMYQVLNRIKSLIDSGDWQLPTEFYESELNWINSALHEVDGIER